MQEAIDTLLKRMEDEWGNLAVIIAEYPGNINIFIQSNRGLQHRFATEIVFEDYTPDELRSRKSALLMIDSTGHDRSTQVGTT